MEARDYFADPVVVFALTALGALVGYFMGRRFGWNARLGMAAGALAVWITLIQLARGRIHGLIIFCGSTALCAFLGYVLAQINNANRMLGMAAGALVPLLVVVAAVGVLAFGYALLNLGLLLNERGYLEWLERIPWPGG